MTYVSDEAWREGISAHLNLPATRMRDEALSEDTEYLFDPLDVCNAVVLFSAFSRNIDSSVLQSFEGALGRVPAVVYYEALGKCFIGLFSANEKVAVERINYPGPLSDVDLSAGFDKFSKDLDGDLLRDMRRVIVSWRLRATEPYASFFVLSLHEET